MTSAFAVSTDASALAEEVAKRCAKATATTTGWLACCPAHDDTHPSLSIDYTADRVLLICRSHDCDKEAIVAALGLTMADLFVKSSTDSWKGGRRRPKSTPRLSHPGPGPRQLSAADIQQRQMAIDRLWRGALPVDLFPGNPAACYLRQRGLWQEPVPEVLRVHWAVPYRHDDGHYSRHPALIASVQAPQDTVVTLHRIYLTHAGAKADVPAPKKLMPTPTTVIGAAVRLDIPTDVLAVTEGIETGLAVRLTAQLPVWAAISAGGMASIVIPDTVRLVLICADHDVKGDGELAAKKLARHLLAEGRRVKILMPSIPGTDWADGLGGGAHG